MVNYDSIILFKWIKTVFFFFQKKYHSLGVYIAVVIPTGGWQGVYLFSNL
jgi:hypothetical protein